MILTVGFLHKIVGIGNVPAIFGKIFIPVLGFFLSAMLSVYIINKNNQIDLIEEIEKDRNFEKIKKREKS